MTPRLGNGQRGKHFEKQVNREKHVMRRRDILKVAGAAVLPGSFAIAQPATARTLRFVPQGGLTVLDPVFTTSPVTAQHGFAIYDTLFAVNARQEVRPQMAEGAAFSDDGRTCLIRLRDELKFHNGEPVLARDCVASLIRWTGRNLSGQAIAEQVDTWGTQDDRTIKIALKRRLPSLLSLVAGDSGFMPFIMPEHVAATSPFKQVTETIGSGPYRFVKDEFVPGSSAAYRRNELYVPRQEPPDASSGGKVAHFDRVEWNAMPDFATATAALRAGEVDWCEHVPADLVPVLRRDPELTVGNAVPSGYTGMLRFNHLQPPFNNVAYRRAVLMAVNQADYMATVSGTDPTASRACKSFFACGRIYGREIGTRSMPADLEAARAALKAAGYHGEKVVLLSPADSAALGPMGDVTHDLLTKMGMSVEMVVTDNATLQQRRMSKEPVEKGGWSIFHGFLSASHLDNPVGNGFARRMGGAGFFGWYADEALEQHVREWLFAETETSRETAADAYQSRAFETVPSIPLGQFHIRTAYRKNLVGRVDGYGVYLWNLRRV
jgi:peptide/nickel transport system substrate-binding protein